MQTINLTGLRRSVLVLAMLAAPALAATPSRDPSAYVLLARQSIRVTRFDMQGDRGGHVGLIGSPGLLWVRNRLNAPGFDVVAPMVQIGGQAICATLYGDDVRGATASCGEPPQAYVRPFEDLAESCGYPTEFPACDPAAPVIVLHGERRLLDPGRYGDLKVQGGGSGDGTLVLAGEGEYRFCNVQVSRGAQIEAEQAATLYVEGTFEISNGVVVGPAPGSGLEEQALRIFVAGPRVRLTRRVSLRAHVFAPRAQLTATSATLVGRFVADSIRARRLTVELSPTVATTTTVTTTTTTSTVPCECGDGRINADCGEICDRDIPCSPGGAFPEQPSVEGSCAGAFGSACSLDCADDCRSILSSAECTTSTTAPTTTTSTTGGSSTTTTLLPPPAAEICGNCVDDDGDGDVDLADDDCCDGANQFASVVRRAKIRARTSGRTLRMRSILANRGLGFDPRVDEVSLVISGSQGDTHLCATVPPGAMRKVGRGWRLNNKRLKLASLQGIDVVRLKQRKNGQLRFRTAGKRVRFLVAPEPGDLDVTVGFRAPAAGGETNRCARARIRIESTRNRKALRYP